jgi:capsular exopolysaccharide synthesis family protein
MERFRKALDKWDARPQPPQRHPLQSPAARGAPTLGEPANGQQQPADGIVYTQTKVATVSGSRARQSRIIAATGDARAAAFQVLRTQVLRACRLHGWRTIGITSVRQGAGKTFSATNLAIAIAREPNQTVLLVDLDLRSPRIAKTFGYPGGSGILECLTGEQTVQEVLFNPGVERLVVLPGSVGDSRASEVLASPRTRELMRELVDRYESRLILCDMAPLAAGDDVLVCLPYLDAVILVVESGRTTSEELDHARELLDGVPIAAVVLNKVREAEGRDSYYDYAYPK